MEEVEVMQDEQTMEEEKKEIEMDRCESGREIEGIEEENSMPLVIAEGGCMNDSTKSDGGNNSMEESVCDGNGGVDIKESGGGGNSMEKSVVHGSSGVNFREMFDAKDIFKVTSSVDDVCESKESKMTIEKCEMMLKAPEFKADVLEVSGVQDELGGSKSKEDILPEKWNKEKISEENELQENKMKYMKESEDMDVSVKESVVMGDGVNDNEVMDVVTNKEEKMEVSEIGEEDNDCKRMKKVRDDISYIKREDKEKSGREEDMEEGELEEGELEDEECEKELEKVEISKELEKNEKEDDNKENKDTEKDNEEDKKDKGEKETKEKKRKEDRKRKQNKESEEEKRKRKKRKHFYNSEDEELTNKKFGNTREKDFDYDALLKKEMLLVGSLTALEGGDSFESGSGDDWEETPRRRSQRARRASRSPSMKNEAICIFYSQGSCKRGGDCPYSHEMIPTRKMELCKFYMMDCCAKREKCLYMHKDFPCKYFHFGMKCVAGEQCKFSHDPLQDVTRNILLKHIELAPKDILGDFPRVSKHDAQVILDVTVAKRGGETVDPQTLEDVLDLEGKGFKYLDKALKNVRRKRDAEKKSEKEKSKEGKEKEREKEKNDKRSKKEEHREIKEKEKEREREKEREGGKDKERIRERDRGERDRKRERERGNDRRARHRSKGDRANTSSLKKREFYNQSPREGEENCGPDFDARGPRDVSKKWYSSDEDPDVNNAPGFRRNQGFSSPPKGWGHRNEEGPHGGQDPYRKGSHGPPYGENSYGPGPHSQTPGPYSQGPGPLNQGPGPHSQVSGPYDEGPGPLSPGPRSHISGPYSQGGPGTYGQGPGSHGQGPGPQSQGPGPQGQGLGPFSQGPGPQGQGGGPFSQGYNQGQGSGPYNQGAFPMQPTLPDIDVMYLKNVLSAVQNNACQNLMPNTQKSEQDSRKSDWDPTTTGGDPRNSDRDPRNPDRDPRNSEWNNRNLDQNPRNSDRPPRNPIIKDERDSKQDPQGGPNWDRNSNWGANRDPQTSDWDTRNPNEDPRNPTNFNSNWDKWDNNPRNPELGHENLDRDTRNLDRPARNLDGDLSNLDKDQSNFDRDPRNLDRDPRNLDRDVRNFDKDPRNLNRDARNLDKDPRNLDKETRNLDRNPRNLDRDARGSCKVPQRDSSQYLDMSTAIKEVFYDEPANEHQEQFDKSLNSLLQSARNSSDPWVTSDRKERPFSAVSDPVWGQREGRLQENKAFSKGFEDKNYGKDPRYPRDEIGESRYPMTTPDLRLSSDTTKPTQEEPKPNVGRRDEPKPNIGRRDSEEKATTSIYDFDFRQAEKADTPDSPENIGDSDLPFKVPMHSSAKEIQAGLNPLTPIYYQLIEVDIPKPDFSRLKLDRTDAKIFEDPRLRKMLRRNSNEGALPQSPRSVMEAHGLPVSPPSQGIELKGENRDPRKMASRDPRGDPKGVNRAEPRIDPRIASRGNNAVNTRVDPRVDPRIERDPRTDIRSGPDSDPRIGGPVFVNGMMDGGHYPQFPPNMGGMPSPMLQPSIDPRGREGLLGPAPWQGPENIPMGIPNPLPQGMPPNPFLFPQGMGGPAPPGPFMPGDRGDMMNVPGIPNFHPQGQWRGANMNFPDPRLNRDMDRGGFTPS